MGVALLAAGMLASGAIKANNQRRALKKQDAETSRGLEAQGAIQREADARINREVTGLQDSSPDAARAELNSGFLDRLRQVRSNAVPGTGGIGSARYAADTAAAQQGVSDYGKRVASLLSRITAPEVQRQNESQRIAQLATDVGGIKRKSDSEAYLTQLRQNGIRPNPWVDFGADVLGGAASAYAAGGFKAPPKNSGIIGPRE